MEGGTRGSVWAIEGWAQACACAFLAPRMSKPMTSDLADDGLLSRPLKDVSIEDIEQLFLAAQKPDREWFVGLELELFGFHREGRAPLAYETLASILKDLGERRGMSPEHELDGRVVGLKGDGMIVSLEPGGQLEFASTPHRTLKSLRNEVCQFTSDLRAIGEKRRVGFWSLGVRPYTDLAGAPRMDKARYHRMRTYFGQRGPRALEMMHLTGSVQCTVDFLDENNLVDKIRTAARVSPFISALTASSPFSKGVPNGYKSLRYQIWLETDEDRAGLWPEMLDEEGLRIRRYLQRAMDAPPVFFIREGRYLPPSLQPMRYFRDHGFEGTPVTVADLVDHLTTFFPEVRPKGYVELRGADGMPPADAVALAGFWRGVLDDEPTRKEVDARLEAMDYEAIRALQPDIARLGLEAVSAAGPVLEVARFLLDAAHRRFLRSQPDCAECLEPLLRRAHEGRSLADDMLQAARRSSLSEAVALGEI